MIVEPAGLPGAWLVRPPVRADARGAFVKPFHAGSLAAAGLRTDFREAYWSRSAPGVLRGMHLQTGAHAHAKLVWCVAGAVHDVALDLRPGPGFGQVVSVELSAENGLALYLPEGVAHGFCVRAGAPEAVLIYMVTSEYAPEADTGAMPLSFGYEWPVAAPLLSPRDQGLPPLAAWPRA